MIKAIKKSAFPHSEPPRHNAPKRPLPERQLLASTLPDLLSLVAPKKLSSAGKIRPPSAAAAPQRAHHALQGEPTLLPGQWAARGGGGHRSSPPAAPQQPQCSGAKPCGGCSPSPRHPSGGQRGSSGFAVPLPALLRVLVGSAPAEPLPIHPSAAASLLLRPWQAGQGKKAKRGGKNKTKQNKTKKCSFCPSPLLFSRCCKFSLVFCNLMINSQEKISLQFTKKSLLI